MLEWIARWGVPLVLVGLLLAAADSHSRDPAALAHHAFDTVTGAVGAIFGRLL